MFFIFSYSKPSRSFFNCPQMEENDRFPWKSPPPVFFLRVFTALFFLGFLFLTIVRDSVRLSSLRFVFLLDTFLETPLVFFIRINHDITYITNKKRLSYL